MKSKSHLILGKYISNGLGNLSRMERCAFIAGCVEPDFNYITYLRGSLSKRMLAGHSFENSAAHIKKIISRIQSHDGMSCRDYFRLGTLLHYVVDSFTYAHNIDFPGSLPDHRDYEKQLKESFLKFLERRHARRVYSAKPLYEALSEAHEKYLRQPASPQKDMRYVEKLACLIFSELVFA